MYRVCLSDPEYKNKILGKIRRLYHCWIGKKEQEEMSTTIELLDMDDTINPEDYIRPLYPSVHFDDGLWETSPYSGAPLDHFKWCKVKEKIGVVWYGKTWREYYGQRKEEFEVIRGELPVSHSCADCARPLRN